jgi:excisionase family DNA binding protein
MNRNQTAIDDPFGSRRAPRHTGRQQLRVQKAAEPSPLPASVVDAEMDKGQPGDALAGRIAYSVAEAAFITGLSRDLLYDQMRIGKLAYLKVGRRRLITRQNLEAFLTSMAS